MSGIIQVSLTAFKPAESGGGGGGIPTSGLLFDMNPHLNSYSNGNDVTTVPNYAAGGVTAEPDPTRRPTFVTNVANGKSAYEFDGGEDRITVSSIPAVTALEVFLVVKIDAQPPPGDLQSGLWDIVATGSSTHFPYTDGNIYDGFGGDTRRTVGVPPANLSTAFRLYNVISTATEHTFRLDHSQIATFGTNTVAFGSTWYVGASETPTYHLDGKVLRLLLYNRKLTTTERNDVAAELKSLYSLSGY